MKVIIVRHAETDENLNNEIGSESAALLNANGMGQAKKLAERLKTENITCAYTSPQKRAVDTAKEILKYHTNAHISLTDNLREQNLGVYEGKPKALWQNFKKESSDPFHLIKPEGGESYAQLQNRAKSFFATLAEKHPNDTVLLVSHGGTIGMLLLDILKKSIIKENYDLHKPANTALTMLEMQGNESVKVHLMNSVDHLTS